MTVMWLMPVRFVQCLPTRKELFAAGSRVMNRVEYIALMAAYVPDAGSFFQAPHMFRNVRTICITTTAQAWTCRPQITQSTLLKRKHQNPGSRLMLPGLWTFCGGTLKINTGCS